MHLIQKTIIKLSSFLSKRLDASLLKNKEFCIISNNCWGNRLYSILKREYNTPFVGLYLLPNDYIKFISQIERNISIEIDESFFINKNPSHPIARIGGCEIHFLHYKNTSEAIDKWNRRRLRLITHIHNYGTNNLIFKFCNINENSMNALNEFDKLKFKRKISITNKSSKWLTDENGSVVNGLILFKGRLMYYKKYITLFRNLPSIKQI